MSSPSTEPSAIESHLLEIASDHTLGINPLDFVFIATLSSTSGLNYRAIGGLNRIAFRGLVAELHDILVELEDQVLDQDQDNDGSTPSPRPSTPLRH